MPAVEKLGWLILDKVYSRLADQAVHILEETVSTELLKGMSIVNYTKEMRKPTDWCGRRSIDPWSVALIPDIVILPAKFSTPTQAVVIIELTWGIIEVRNPIWMQDVLKFAERWEQERGFLIEELCIDAAKELGRKSVDNLPRSFSDMRRSGQEKQVKIIEG